jgi:hypothetical protein
MQDQKFKIYGFLDLKKSLSTSSVDKDGYIIEGRFMNSVRDIAGEKPIVPEMIWDILRKSGNIKYEHDPMAVRKMEDGSMMAVSEANPKNIIGVPLEIKTSPDGKEAFFRATLFPQNELVKSLVAKAKEFDEHNRRFPEHQRHFQLSVEGKYLKKNITTREYAGIAENIVITPQAQDGTTYLKFVNAENLAMAKSLQAGYETNLPNMKNGDALREESLEGKNNSHSTRRKTMEKHGKNKDEVFQHFMGVHKDKKKAQEATEKYYEELEKEKGEEKGEFKKSHEACGEKIQKSITALLAVADAVTAKQVEIVKLDTEMKKSIVTLRETPDQFSPEQFISQNTEAIVNVGTSVNEIQAQLAKSISVLAEGLAAVLPLLSSIHEIADEAREQAADANETARYMARGMKKSMTGFTRSTDNMATLTPGAEPVSDDQMLKSVNVRAAKNYLADKIVANQSNPTLVAEYNQAYTALDDLGNNGFDRMSKSVKSEIAGWYKLQLPAVQQ